MGPQLIADIWIANMIMPGTPECRPASKLLRAQVLTFNRTQHIIALNDEYPRKRISEEIKKGQLPRIWVRCFRCGTIAWLTDWIIGAELSGKYRQDRIAQLIATHRASSAEFLMPCTATSIVELADSLSEPDKEANSL